MKKITMLTAAMVAAVAVWASAAEPVYSSNIVGYQKISLGAEQIRQIGVQFRNIGGDAINIQDLFAGDVDNLAKGLTAGTADTIMIWDAVNNKYHTYFIHSGGGKNNAAKKDKWVDESGNIADVAIAPGTGFFFTKINADATATISGEVVPSTVDSIVIKRGIEMMAAPFTSDYDINNDAIIDWSTYGTKGLTAGTADTIMIWDAEHTKYNTYFLHSGGGKNNASKKDKWIDESGAVTDLVIPMGQAFFYTSMSDSDTAVEVVAPYGK